jgi:DNA-binding Xre family transcriptional regulator
MCILDEDLKNLPKTLIQMRLELGWNKTDLAHALGLDRADQVCRWESTNYSTISFKRLLKVISVLKSATQNKQNS